MRRGRNSGLLATTQVQPLDPKSPWAQLATTPRRVSSCIYGKARTEHCASFHPRPSGEASKRHGGQPSPVINDRAVFVVFKPRANAISDDLESEQSASFFDPRKVRDSHYRDQAQRGFPAHDSCRRRVYADGWKNKEKRVKRSGSKALLLKKFRIKRFPSKIKQLSEYMYLPRPCSSDVWTEPGLESAIMNS